MHRVAYISAILAASGVAASPFASLAVNVSSGAYALNVNGALVAASASDAVSICVAGVHYSLGSGSLSVQTFDSTSGVDALGPYGRLTLVLASSNFSFNASFSTYSSVSGIVFSASFPVPLSFAGCASGPSDLGTLFPAWSLTPSLLSEQSFTHVLANGVVTPQVTVLLPGAAPLIATGAALTWSSEASSNTKIVTPGSGGVASLSASGLDHGPVVIGSAPAGVAVVLSSLDHHKIVGQVTSAGSGSMAPVTSLWSASRCDQVACVTQTCLNDQQPQGNYTTQRVEGYAVLLSESAAARAARRGKGPGIRVGDAYYPTVPLTVYYSASQVDNAVLSNASAPSGYDSFVIADAYVFTAPPPPGTVPLQVYLKVYNASHQDYASVASAEGIAWAVGNGYTYQFDAGFVFPNASSPGGNSSYYASGLTGAIAAGIPAGFSYSTIAYAGNGGITATMYGYGAAMQTYYNTTRLPSVTLRDLGMYTDDGAYYYVWTNWGMSRPWPAEVGLLDVIQNLNAQGIFPQYLQLDDWWYDGAFFFGNVKSITNWTGDTEAALFPHGLPAFQAALGLPLILYTPFWADDYVTIYNMTESTSFKGTKLVTPDDSAPFFTDLMATGQALSNGHMKGYEIDFLGSNFLGSASMFETVDSAHTWYAGMANAALAQNIAIQYCLSYPSDILMALEFPAVTNARASPDYVNKHTNAYDIGGSALLMGALAIGPSKDTLWTRSPQPPTMSDTERNYTEQPHVQLDVILATLSLGPVGFSDGLNQTDVGLLSQSCMSNGTLLRPSRPVSWVDSHFFNGSSSPDVRATHSSINGSPYANGVAAWHVLAWETPDDLTLQPGDLFPVVDASLLLAVRVHDWSTGAGSDGCTDGEPATAACVNVTVSSAVIVPAAMPAPGEITYMRVVPLMPNGWFLLGELSKVANVSPQRITALDVSGTGVVVTLAGGNGEAVCMTAVSPQNIVRVVCDTLSASGTGSITFTA